VEAIGRQDRRRRRLDGERERAGAQRIRPARRRQDGELPGRAGGNARGLLAWKLPASWRLAGKRFGREQSDAAAPAAIAVIEARRRGTAADRRNRLGGGPPPRVLLAVEVEDSAGAREHEVRTPLLGIDQSVERQFRIAIALVDER